MIQEIDISSNAKEEIIDLTTQIQQIIGESKINEGLCTVYCPHTTAGVTINENYDSDVKRDILFALNKIVPKEGYNHSEGNSEGHVKSSLVGLNQTIIIENSNLKLGQWQGIYFCEFDGPRKEKYILKLQVITNDV